MKLIRFQVTDSAMKLGAAAMQIVGPLIDEADHRRVFDLFVKAATATLLSYDEKVSRLRRRIAMEPGTN